MTQESFEVTPAGSTADIDASFPIVRELRTHMTDAEAYRAQVLRQMEDGYTLVLLRVSGEVAGCAGFRIHETLSRGRYMYVEDLVTSPKMRSLGLGDHLFDWLANEAREKGCAQMEVISGIQREAAHRFYYRKRMAIKAFQFVLPL